VRRGLQRAHQTLRDTKRVKPVARADSHARIVKFVRFLVIGTGLMMRPDTGPDSRT